MKNLIIERDPKRWYIPGVHFDAKKGTCVIEGESSLEDCDKFYGKLKKWITEYCKSHKEISIDFKLNYFNTGSSKGILDILMILKDFKAKGGKVSVNWYYTEDDEDVIDDVQDFENATKLNIKLIMVED